MSYNLRVKARARDINPTKKPKPCYSCGLNTTQSDCTLFTPFRLRPFDFSPPAYDAARRVISLGEAKIAKLDKAIHQMRLRREQMRRTVQQHRGFVAPVHRLTDDIFVLIFEEASRLPAVRDTHWHLPSLMLAVRPPWEISAVCRRWRQIALSTTCAHLWRHVDLDPPYPRNAAPPFPLHVFRSVLQADRSRPSTLHMSLPSVSAMTKEWEDSYAIRNQSDVERHNLIARLQAVLQRLVTSNIHKCRSLQFGGYSSDVLIPQDAWFAGASIPPRLESLEYLTICDATWLDSQAKGTLDLPRLRSVTLEGENLDNLPARWWTNNITHLHFTNCESTPHTLLDLLRNTRNLEELTIRNILFSTTSDDADPSIPLDEANTQSIRLHSLLHLELDFQNYQEELWEYILRHQGIHAPNITSLVLKEVHTPTQLTAVRNPLGTSSSSHSVCTSLTISRPTLNMNNSEPLIGLLSELPALERLAITDVDDFARNVDGVLLALTWPRSINGTSPGDPALEGVLEENQQATRICPRLQALCLEFMTMDSTILRRMVESRVPGDESRGRDTPTSFLKLVDLGVVYLTDNEDEDHPLSVNLAESCPDQLEWLLWMVEEDRLEVEVNGCPEPEYSAVGP